MNLNEKIYIAGHRGLVGSAIIRELKSRGFTNLLTRTHEQLNLTDQREVNLFFDKEKPCLLYTSPSPRDDISSRMPSSA